MRGLGWALEALESLGKGLLGWPPGKLVSPARGGGPWSQRPHFPPSSQRYPPQAGDVFTARDASLTIWDRQQLSVASPPHFLASQTTPLSNLAIGLRPLHGSWWALGSSLQPTTSQNSCLPSGFQPMSNQQHDTQKWSAYSQSK